MFGPGCLQNGREPEVTDKESSETACERLLFSLEKGFQSSNFLLH